MVLRIQGAILAIALCGCASYPPRPYPWNFPPEEEWNQPFETSWQNAVDMYKRLTAPKGKIWDPLMRNYQQDLSCDYPESTPVSEQDSH
jgi:hypothetical protein